MAFSPWGRLAWDPEADAREIAAEWAAQTFTPEPAFVNPVVDMMMISREAVVNYMTPLGLHHQMASGHHYGPGPWIANWIIVFPPAKGSGIRWSSAMISALRRWPGCKVWERMKPYVDAERFGQVAAFLDIQHREAQRQCSETGLAERELRGAGFFRIAA
jgi:alpha-glucuronidase